MKASSQDTAATGKSDPIRGAQAIARATDILLAFSHDRPSRSLSDLAGELELPLSTTHRIAMALESRGLLVQAQRGKEFSLGPAILQLASVLIEQYDLAEAARPSLERIRRETRETASVHRKVGDVRVCLAELPSTHEIKITSGVGRSYPLHAGAASKAILAQLPDSVVDHVIGLMTPMAELTLLTPAELREQLGQIRERGYAISEGETIRGASSVAVPIPTADPDSPAALLVTGPSERLDPNIDSVAALLLDEARQIARR